MTVQNIQPPGSHPADVARSADEVGWAFAVAREALDYFGRGDQRDASRALCILAVYAERYRYLRDRPGAKSADGYGLLVVTDEPNRIPRYLGPVMGENLDAAIDAATSS